MSTGWAVSDESRAPSEECSSGLQFEKLGLQKEIEAQN
jgi:hypothetical protein